jgi:toxin-antitoxin system PIN domain toxin
MTSNGSVDLLDVSVWLPLAVRDHEHHARALRYWEDESAPTVAVCRITALAFLRLLTNPRVMCNAALSSNRAWIELGRWLALPEIVFLGEPEQVHERLGRFASALPLGPASWTDAYLAAFAITTGCRMVTFDGGFAQYADLDLLRLEV